MRLERIGDKCMRLKNKVAIVTGASQGIGKAIAEKYVSEGAALVLADIKEQCHEVSKELNENGGRTTFVRADVSDENDVKRIVANTIRMYGRIDILCNNAAVNIPGSVMELSEEDWEKTMAVNVKSIFLTTKHVIPVLQMMGGGAVVNLASANSYVAEPKLAAYVSSKGAISALTKQIALDVARDNVRVNCICPGWVNTDFNDAHLSLFGGKEKALENIAEVQPIGRMIEPIEVANAALFLASDEASGITGTSLLVDGGLTAK